MPSPSRWFSWVSALIIAGSLFFLTVFIALIIVEPNPLTMMLGALGLPLSAVMAVQQYRGTFRQVPSGGTTTSRLLYICGGGIALVAFSLVKEAAAGNTSPTELASILVPMLLMAAFLLGAGRMNALWVRQLRVAIDSGAVVPNPSGFSLRELLLTITIVAAVTGLTAQWIRSSPPSYAEHIEAAAAPLTLPKGAQDVSYAKGSRGSIALEFTTDEASFRDWVSAGIGSAESDAARISLQTITSPFTIDRYYIYASELNGPNEIVINSGLYYSWTKEDRGVYAAFDDTSGRAYYEAHFH